MEIVMAGGCTGLYTGKPHYHSCTDHPTSNHRISRWYGHLDGYTSKSLWLRRPILKQDNTAFLTFHRWWGQICSCPSNWRPTLVSCGWSCIAGNTRVWQEGYLESRWFSKEYLKLIASALILVVSVHLWACACYMRPLIQLTTGSSKNRKGTQDQPPWFSESGISLESDLDQLQIMLEHGTWITMSGGNLHATLMGLNRHAWNIPSQWSEPFNLTNNLRSEGNGLGLSSLKPTTCGGKNMHFAPGTESPTRKPQNLVRPPQATVEPFDVRQVRVPVPSASLRVSHGIMSSTEHMMDGRESGMITHKSHYS